MASIGYMPLWQPHKAASQAPLPGVRRIRPCQRGCPFGSSVAIVTDYATCLAELYGRPPQDTALGLARMQALLSALGDPQDHVRSVVVAGTNGKGSTCHLVAQALRRAGHRVGLFTSPHLLAFGERIRVDNEPIGRQEVIRGLARIYAAAQAHALAPTFFEVTTALGLCHFAERQVDLAVLEVGLGGRLDATNAARKALTVLTPISYDHEALLGRQLAQIAAEKAAILTAGVPAVIAPQAAEAQAVIDARLEILAIDAQRTGDGEAAFSHVMPPYQRQNFACAQAVCEVLHRQGIAACPPAAFAQASATFSWPGRYQWLTPENEPDAQLPCPVILDGGHNPAGALALQKAIAEDVRMANRPIHVIFAVVQGKDAEAMLKALAPWASSWRVCGLKSKRRRDAQELAYQIGRGAQGFETFDAAWQDVLAHPPESRARIVVCGSLFLVADALACLTRAERDPPIDG